MFLSKRNNGYYYLVYKDEATNKRKVVSTKTKLKSKANTYLLTYKRQYDYGNENINHHSNVYLSELRDEVNGYISIHLTPASIQIYNKVFKNLFAIIGNKRLKLITSNDIENYKATRLNDVKKATVNIEIRTLKAIFNLAVKLNFIQHSPVKYIKQFSLPQKERLSFNEAELKILLSAIEDVGLKNIVLFALYTGCRISEILNVQWKDINFRHRTLTIKNKNDFKTKSGKNRTIPISDNLFNLLKTILKLSTSNNIIPLNTPDDYIFKNRWNYKYNRSTIAENFKRYIRKANLNERFHFHCLRHTFITQLIKKGVNLNYVKEIAGHSVIQTTMSYIYIVTDDLRQAMDKIKIV